MSNMNITNPSTGTAEGLVPNHNSSNEIDQMAEDLNFFLGIMDDTQEDEEDATMGDAAIPLDELALEFVFDHEAGIAVPPPTPVDGSEHGALEENIEVDSNAAEEYNPGDLPPGFPMQLGRLIRHIPHDGGPRCRPIRKFAVGLITLPYGSGSPENIQLLQQLAAFVAQVPPDIFSEMEKIVTELVLRCMGAHNSVDFELGHYIQELPFELGRQFMDWLTGIPDQVVEDIFGVQITGVDLRHLLHHTFITVIKGPEVEVSIMLQACECDFGYRKKICAKTVQKFIDSLPDVPLDSLAEDDRNCGICRGAYKQDPSLLNGSPETAMRLPCGHVFGELCLTVLLSPKPDGWAHRLCPLCRALVPVLSKSPLGDILQAGRLFAVVE